MTKNQKRELYKIIVSAALLILAAVLKSYSEVPAFISVAVFLAAYFIVGLSVILHSVKSIAKGDIFNEFFLMSIATVGAIFLKDYAEGAAVMLFYTVGDLFESIAVSKSRKSVASLLELRPDYANIERDGKVIKVDPYEVEIGDTVTVFAGERFPLDGTLLDGSCFVDSSALTGESVPKELTSGDTVLSGSINVNATVKVTVTKTAENSTVQRILDLVENTRSNKTVYETFITRFARWYTPIVVFSAVLLAVVPSLIVGNFLVWFERALVFLVISCPCALVVSVPLSFFSAIGGASKKGILIKGSPAIEQLSRAGTIVFDKTGTLTAGNFKVQKVESVGITEGELLHLAALAESQSSHPIAGSLREAYSAEINSELIKSYEVITGMGVKTEIADGTVLAGNYKLMKQFGIACDEKPEAGTTVYVALNGEYKGNILISDTIKPGSKSALERLKTLGVGSLIMLTGDAAAPAKAVGDALAMDKVYSELLPDDKLRIVEEMKKDADKNKTVVFVGDGMNDAPVLLNADVGIAMGGIGSDAAIEAADIVLMNDEPGLVPEALRLCRRTMLILKQDIAFILVVKFMVLLLGALGLANMWAAVFADVGVMVLAVLNSFRTLKG